MIFTLVFNEIRNVFFTALEISVEKKSLNMMVCFCKWRGQAPCFSVPGTLLPAQMEYSYISDSSSAKRDKFNKRRHLTLVELCYVLMLGHLKLPSITVSNYLKSCCLIEFLLLAKLD